MLEWLVLLGLAELVVIGVLFLVIDGHQCKQEDEHDV